MNMTRSGPVVVIVDGQQPPRWQVEAVLQLAVAVGNEQVIMVPWECGGARGSGLLRDRWLARHFALSALAPTDLPSGVPVHRGTTNTLPSRVGTAQVICLVQDEEALAVLPADAWRLQGDSDHPGADATLRGDHVAGLALSDGNGKVLARAVVHTDARHPGRVAEALLDQVMRWPAELIGGRPVLTSDQQEAFPVPAPAGNLTVLRHWLGLGRSSMRANERPTEAEEWNIGLLHQPVESLVDQGNSMNVRWLPAPAAGSHRMKPSGYLDTEGRLTALYTKFDGREDRWSLARVRPKGDNVLKRSRSLLELTMGGDHASVVPESEGPLVVIGAHEGRSTALYRMNAGGDGLEPGPVILDRRLCSPILFQHAGKWWLMGTDPEWPDAMLVLFHAPSIQGPYTPHPRGPVKLDVSSARPAGPPFTAQGRLWRPAVDASDPAHPTVVIMAVEHLSPDQFQEHVHRKLPLFSSTFYPHGCRTIHGMGDVTLVDGLKRNDGRVPQRPSGKGRKRRSSRQKRS